MDVEILAEKIVQVVVVHNVLAVARDVLLSVPELVIQTALEAVGINVKEHVLEVVI